MKKLIIPFLFLAACSKSGLDQPQSGYYVNGTFRQPDSVYQGLGHTLIASESQSYKMHLKFFQFPNKDAQDTISSRFGEKKVRIYVWEGGEMYQSKDTSLFVQSKYVNGNIQISVPVVNLYSDKGNATVHGNFVLPL